MDDTLQHVCETADIAVGKKTKEKFARHGITSFQDLMASRNILDSTKGSENDLLKTIGWYEKFQQREGTDPNMLTDFTEDAFEEYKKMNKTYEVTEDALQEFIREFRHKPELKELLETTEGLLQRIQEKEVTLIKSKIRPNLKKALRSFDVEGFALEAVKSVYTNHAEERTGKLVFVAGKTQSGKSAVTAVASIACHEIKAPSVVITKGVSESRELTKKLRSFVEGTPLEQHIVSISNRSRKERNSGEETTGVSWKNKRAEIEAALRSNGTIICADTGPQIKKVIHAITQYRQDGPNEKFVLVVDECDAVICRTDKRSTKIEEAYDELKDMKPSLTVMISATPVPLMMEVVNQESYSSSDVSNVFLVEPDKEYSGVHDMELLVDSNGKQVYLDQRELSYSNHYTSSKDRLLIEYALKDPSKKGVLLLDCTNPRVYAAGNVMQKAVTVQEMAASDFGRDVVVMLNIGSGIQVRGPGGEWERIGDADIDEAIEDVDEKYGLETPLFIFGFTKMRRGISYRSTRRVPTFIIVVLGGGHNVMNLVQTLGRATFNGKSILTANGFHAVTLLAPLQDYTAVKKQLNYVDYVFQKIISGESFHDALTGANAAIPDWANFFRHTTRHLGQIKQHREDFGATVNFEQPSDMLKNEELRVRENYYELLMHQRVMRTIFEMTTKNCDEIKFKEIQEAFNDTFLDDDVSIGKQELNSILRMFVQDAVLQESKNGDKGWYRVAYQRKFRNYINDELVLTSSEREDGFNLESALGLDGVDESVSGISDCDGSTCEYNSSAPLADDEDEDEVPVVTPVGPKRSRLGAPQQDATDNIVFSNDGNSEDLVEATPRSGNGTVMAPAGASGTTGTAAMEGNGTDMAPTRTTGTANTAPTGGAGAAIGTNGTAAMASTGASGTSGEPVDLTSDDEFFECSRELF